MGDPVADLDDARCCDESARQQSLAPCGNPAAQALITPLDESDDVGQLIEVRG